jgi:hypothetical protein
MSSDELDPEEVDDAECNDHVVEAAPEVDGYARACRRARDSRACEHLVVRNAERVVSRCFSLSQIGRSRRRAAAGWAALLACSNTRRGVTHSGRVFA